MIGEHLTAGILVGGKSRRMGQDKALLTLEPGGPAVIEIVAGRLRVVTSEIVLVGSTAPDVLPDVRRIADSFSGSGPLGGIHAALTAAGSERVLVVACDMPFLSVALLRFMASLSGTYDVLVPVLDRPHPLHAIYARSCLPHIERSLQAGGHQVTGWFDAVDVREIDRATIERYDPELLSCFNMNAPEDHAFAMQVHARRARHGLDGG